MPFAANAGVRINYETVGSGPPIVLHIGYMGRLQDWSREDVGLVQAIRDQHQVIALDPRGFGESDKPHDPAAYAQDLLVGDVVAVLDDLGIDKAHFWGYSRGGSVGYAIGTRASDRFRSLIIGGSHPYARDPARMIEDAEMLRAMSMSAYVELLEQRIGPLPGELRSAWLANDPLALAAMNLEQSTRAGIEANLSAIALPALLYCGDEDPPYELMQQAAAAMARATFVPLRGLNHGMAFRRAREVLLPQVRAFLERTMAAA